MRQLMKQTPARTRFKQHFGQANHFLVTNLVALRNLEASDVISAPPELHTTWNPQNKRNSINRTWAFTLQTALASAVDSIDMYLSLLYRWPNYIRDASLCSALDGTERSVSRKVVAVSRHYSIDPLTVAMVDVLITWRNNIIHELAENTLRVETISTLAERSSDIALKYRGLVVDQLPVKVSKGEDLSFKEAASLINAAHEFVRCVDEAVIANLDLESLCFDVVGKSLSEDASFSQKYYMLPEEKRRRFVLNWLSNSYGISNFPVAIVERSLHIAKRAGDG